MPVEFGAKRGVSVLVALALVLGLLAAGAGVARAEGLDYEAPAEWLLPWRGGDVHRVTWGPEDHWANGKATGIVAGTAAKAAEFREQGFRFILLASDGALLASTVRSALADLGRA